MMIPILRWWRYLLLAPAVCVIAALARAGGDDGAAVRAEHLAHLLGYVDADYARVGANEQREHLAMIDAAKQVALGLPRPPELRKDIASVGVLLESMAPATEVHARVTALRARLAQSYGIAQAPPATPSASRGRALYEQHCAACHGLTGRADTPVAATLRPHPANFREALFGETLSPYDVTTAVRFGVDGTPMAAVPSLGERDRWDLAFYVIGLRHPGPLAEAVPPWTVRELARTSDHDLREVLFASGIGGARLEPTLGTLRRLSPFEAPGAWPAEDGTATPTRAAPEMADRGPCSEPGFGPGPELRVTDASLPFDVTHDCMFPGHARLEITVNWRTAERPRRAQVDALLRGLFSQVRSVTGAGMPDLTHICVFPAGTSNGEDPYGCLQFEADDGPQGEFAVQVDLPFEAGEWARTLAESRSRGLTRSERPQVTVDEPSARLAVTVPFAEPVTVGRAAVHLFSWLFDFYPPKTEVQAIVLAGVYQGKTVLEVRVADLRAFLSMDPWAIRERMAALGIPIEPGAARTAEQEAVLEKEYVRALAKLPKAAVPRGAL